LDQNRDIEENAENLSDLVDQHVEYISHLTFKKWVFGACLLIVALSGIVISAGIGPVKVPPAIAARILISKLPGLDHIWHKPKEEITDRDKLRDLENYEIWIWQGRMPRIIVALLVGAGLSVSGVIFQGLVLNPLASSGTLGVSAGAAAGASTFIVFGSGLSVFSSAWGIPVAALAGGLITLGLVWFVARSGRGATSPLSLILAGVIMGIFLGSAMSFIRIVAEEESLRALTLWGVGSLASREWLHVKMAVERRR
jgi:iron complex transport system permease protein